MALNKNSIRGRVTESLRLYTILPVLSVTLSALIFHSFSWGWIVVVLAAGASIALAYNLSEGTAKRVVSDLEGLIGAFTTFNSGVLSIRARGASTKEIRQLVDGFNKMAIKAEHAINTLNAEEKRQMQFVSDVSHELRTPLTAIRGAAETLLMGGLSREEQERFLSTISTESMRLTGLAEDLLTLRRIEGATGEIPLRSINLTEAAERVGKMMSPVFAEREVNFHITGEAPHILGDINRIQQVIANLVDNASRMIGPNGNVWIDLSSAHRMELGTSVPAKSFVDVDRFAIMSICDDGPGIPEDNLEHIFDRFYRTDVSRARNRGGSGLGLSIVKAIVSSHGGTIEVDNRPTGGAQFTIYLPIPPDFEYSAQRLIS